MDQIKGVREKLDMLAKGRENQEKIRATQARNPGDGLKTKKGKGKNKKEPQMLGPAVMATNVEKSRFKSSFGKLEPVAVKRVQPKVQRRTDTRKLVSFFDSQRIDRSQLYNPEGHQSGVNNGAPQD